VRGSSGSKKTGVEGVLKRGLQEEDPGSSFADGERGKRATSNQIYMLKYQRGTRKGNGTTGGEGERKGVASRKKHKEEELIHHRKKKSTEGEGNNLTRGLSRSREKGAKR